MNLIDYSVRSTEERHRNSQAYAQPPGRLEQFVVHGDREMIGSQWLESVIFQSSNLLKLRAGWAGISSVPVEPRLVESMIVDVLPDVMPPHSDAIPPRIVPTRDGGLQLEWHRGGWDVEVLLSPYSRAWVDCARADGADMWDGPLSDNIDPLRVILKEIA